MACFLAFFCWYLLPAALGTLSLALGLFLPSWLDSLDFRAPLLWFFFLYACYDVGMRKSIRVNRTEQVKYNDNKKCTEWLYLIRNRKRKIQKHLSDHRHL